MTEINENQSLTEIVNSALVGIGDNTINSLYDQNDGKAKLCRMLVEQCIREVQSHPSGCWSELEEFGELTANDKSYSKDTCTYNLPNNCISIKWVKTAARERVPFRVSGLSLKTPTPVRYVCFVRYSDNPEEWSSEMKSCVIGLLSAKLLAAIAKNYAVSRQAVEAFWSVEFPRWAGNRANKSESAIPGQDSELSVLWGERPHTALNNPDW
jgi:hypothetical protein